MSSSTRHTLEPLSPFLCFCHANREEVQAANPTANRFVEIPQILSDLWREMSESDKAIYSNRVVQSMARQMSDMIQERGDLRLLVDRTRQEYDIALDREIQRNAKLVAARMEQSRKIIELREKLSGNIIELIAKIT